MHTEAHGFFAPKSEFNIFEEEKFTAIATILILLYPIY